MVEAIRKISIYTHTERSQMESTSHIISLLKKQKQKQKPETETNKKKLYTKPPEAICKR